jgi:hypothetical protein
MNNNGRVLNKVHRTGTFYSLFPSPYSLFPASRDLPPYPPPQNK